MFSVVLALFTGVDNSVLILHLKIPWNMVTFDRGNSVNSGICAADGELVTWCTECELRQPARSAHCYFCNVCIRGRDHHCIWSVSSKNSLISRIWIFVLHREVIWVFLVPVL